MNEKEDQKVELNEIRPTLHKKDSKRSNNNKGPMSKQKKYSNCNSNILLNNKFSVVYTDMSSFIPGSMPTTDTVLSKFSMEEEMEEKKGVKIKKQEKSFIEKFDDKIDTRMTSMIQNLSILPLNTIKDKSISPDCYLGPAIIPSHLLSKIMKVDKNDVLSPILTIKSRFCRKIPIEEIMSWQKTELDEPLLRMADDHDKEGSIQMFRNLLSYMKERISSKEPLSHAYKFIRVVNAGNHILKDEAYLQVYKQLNNNPNRESLMRTWKFLAIISSCFIPDNEDIYHLILNFLFFKLKDEKKLDEQLQKHINYIFVHLVKTANHERTNMPCMEELEYIERLKSIPIPIYFFSGKQTLFKVEPYTTFKEIKANIMGMLDFNKQRAMFYSIYEICFTLDGTEERFIDDNEIVGDVLSLWKGDIEKYTMKKKAILFRFYLKLLIYYPYDDTNIDTISIIYYQTLYDVVTGKFNLTEDDILILSSLQLINEFGSALEKAYLGLKENYERYIPGNKLLVMSKDQYIEKIMETYNMLLYYSKKECKIEYIKLLEGYTTYQAQQFDAKFHREKSSDNDDDIPFDCILGFQPEGIIILNADRERVCFYEYTTIKNWGISAHTFVIMICKNEKKLRRLAFITGETNVIQTLMEMYGYIIVGLGLKDMQILLEERDNKFSNNTQRRRIATKYSRNCDSSFSEERKRVNSFVYPLVPYDNED